MINAIRNWWLRRRMFKRLRWTNPGMLHRAIREGQGWAELQAQLDTEQLKRSMDRRVMR